jgi:hypothetical protein
MPLPSFSNVKNSHVSRRKLEKKDLDPLFYIKGFGRLRFNPLKLIWIQDRSFPIWEKTKRSN